MAWLGPLLIGLLVASSVIQLVWAYALSAIARKTEQSGLMELLAWIPILQIAPMLAAGGGSVLRFAIGAIGLVIGNGILVAVATVLGGAFGRGLAFLGLGLSALLCIFYFGQIAWNTAVARDCPGWVGLLCFVPLANLFVYPYLAFHDGWPRPNPLGLLIGLVLVVGSTAPGIQTARMMNDSPEMATALAALTSLNGAGGGFALEAPTGSRKSATEGGPRDPDPSIRALYQLKERFEALDGLTASDAPLDAARRASATGLIQTLRGELESHRGELDPKTFEELAFHVLKIEARLHASEGSDPGSPAVPARSARPAREFDPVPALPAPVETVAFDRDSAPPIRPFPVQAADGCPPGTELRSQNDGGHDEEWCQQRPEQGGLRHGWYARYTADGRPESMGEYRNGLRVGVWTRFHENGAVRAQAEFRKGLQHGWVLTFDETGLRTRAVRYEDGVVRR